LAIVGAELVFGWMPFLLLKQKCQSTENILKVRRCTVVFVQSKKKLSGGECIRISTGAAVPPSADAVVQVEDTQLLKATEDGKTELEIMILKAPSSGQDIR